MSVVVDPERVLMGEVRPIANEGATITRHPGGADWNESDRRDLAREQRLGTESVHATHAAHLLITKEV
jgi:hypothetical protein